MPRAREAASAPSPALKSPGSHHTPQGLPELSVKIGGTMLQSGFEGVGAFTHSRFQSQGDSSDSRGSSGFLRRGTGQAARPDKNVGLLEAELRGLWFLPGDRSPLLASSPSAVPRDSGGLWGLQHPTRAGEPWGLPKDEPVGQIWFDSGLGMW